MANRAILLVEAALGKSIDVMLSLRKLECVKSADRVTPPYDVIAIVEVDASREVTEEIQHQLGAVDGITRVVVCSIQDSDLPWLAPLSRADSPVLSSSQSL
jgi:DNA-binding Lrp family transcriptional regulator